MPGRNIADSAKYPLDGYRLKCDIPFTGVAPPPPDRFANPRATRRPSRGLSAGIQMPIKTAKPTTKKKPAKVQPAPAFKSYALRTCAADMTSRNGFKWPTKGRVEAPDWDPWPACGNGLHGLLMGKGDASLCNWNHDAVWQVVGIHEWVELNGKVKFPAGTVIYTGDLHGAAKMLQSLGAGSDIVGGTATAGVGGTATAGYRGTATAGDSGTATAGVGGTATAGYRGTATAGDRGTATAGDGGTATAGDGGTATAGYRGTATAGYRGTATAGDRGTATAGDRGTATAGDGGCLAIHYWDSKREKWRVRIAEVGEDGIEANTAYQLQGDKFVRVPTPSKEK